MTGGWRGVRRSEVSNELQGDNDVNNQQLVNESRDRKFVKEG